MEVKGRKLGNIAALIAIILVMSTVNISALEDKSIEMKDLLPRYQNYEWIYHGFVEYGHTMEIDSIEVKDNELRYFLSGHVHDISGGEADTDFSLSMEYIIKPDRVVQIKDEEAMLDSKFDRIEIISGPLKKGTTWTQEVEGDNGETYILESIIEEIKIDNGYKIFTVLYEDIDGPYYEKREIKEKKGVISFERLMYGEDEDYPVQYSIFDSSLKKDVDFNDIEGKDNKSYILKLEEIGLIHGYPDNTYRPDQNLNVAECIKLILHTLGYNIENGEDEWYETHVKKAIDLNIISEYDFDGFNRQITKGEMKNLILNSTEIDEEIMEDYNTTEEYISRGAAAKIFYIINSRLDIGFSTLDAIVLEEELEKRLYQETVESDGIGLNRVRDFDSKDELRGFLSEVIDKDLAEDYINDFYEERDNNLYLIPRDGITKIDKNSPFTLKIQNPRKYVLIQESYSALIGDEYTLEITYEYYDENWIITERELNID